MSMHSSYYVDGKLNDRRSCLAIECFNVLVISNWLSMQELGNLDMAVSNHSVRESWLNTLKASASQAVDEWHHSHTSMKWVMLRCIRITTVLVKQENGFKLSDSTLETVSANVLRNVVYDDVVSRRELVIWEGCKYLKSIDLSRCQDITDIGVSALGHGCSQLQSIDLSYCRSITDIGVSALGHGCGQLQSIDLSYCRSITDIGISALGHGCGQLQSIDLSYCQDITDIGISTLGHGCGQLQTINLSYCQDITDIGVSALGHGCGQLQSINLRYCRNITDIGISALGHGCGQLQSINLCGCDNITDTGVSALRARNNHVQILEDVIF